MRHKKMDWIQGDRFRDMAKYTYSPKVKSPNDDYDNLPNTLDLSAFNDGDIIYTHMMYVKQLFDIMQWMSKKFILISHSCDSSIEDYGMRRPDGRGRVHDIFEFELPKNLIKWYSKNVNTINPRIESIPIGVENAMWHKKIPKLDLMIEQKEKCKHMKELAYINHSIKTNSEKRKVIYDLFKDKPWTTFHYRGNGVDFEQYLYQLYNHKFVFSPEGNGMDTIRTWECLYMNTIPIEKRNINNQFYTDLPICFVDEWEQVDKVFLLKEYKRIKESNWNMDKLKFGYWKKKILST